MTEAVAFLVVVLCALVSYLLGSINLSIIISKLMGKGDIRDYGSKNAGTTNTLRVLGVVPALVVFIWDILKGVLAVVLTRCVANYIIGPESLHFNGIYCYSILASSLAVVLGHNFPAFFGFRGGKGVATSLGVLLTIEPHIGLICLIAGIIGIALFQMVSVGSLIAAIEYPILVCIIGGHFDTHFNLSIKYRAAYIAFSFILALLVMYRHRGNIERIKNGTENRLKFRKTPEEKIKEEKASTEEKIEEVKEEIQVPVEDSVEKADIKMSPKKEKKSKK